MLVSEMVLILSLSKDEDHAWRLTVNQP